MLKQEDEDGGGGGTGDLGCRGPSGNNWARVCDTCRSAACTVYCRADSAYLCTSCDTRIHAANKVASRHERVWICEACERAPAVFLCKADAASLCATCDSDIHSANPLARRHHRIPILPIPGTLYGTEAADPGERLIGHHASGSSSAIGDHVDNEAAFFTNEADQTNIGEDDDDDEASSWILLNPMSVKNNNHHQNHQSNTNNGMMYGGEGVDEYLDLVEYSSCQERQFADQQYAHKQQNYSGSIHDHHQKGFGCDSIVPDRSGYCKNQLQQSISHSISFQLGLDHHDVSNIGYTYPASMSHSVSVSSMDVGVVPESTLSDVTISHSRPPKGTIDLFSSPPIQMPQQLTPMDREARVLRYREKKKTRKFEKTIRYASRKAYAETRPRIKGRFAKRIDVEVEVEMLSTTSMAESGYGIVPSF